MPLIEFTLENVLNKSFRSLPINIPRIKRKNRAVFKLISKNRFNFRKSQKCNILLVKCYLPLRYFFVLEVFFKHTFIHLDHFQKTFFSTRILKVTF